MNEFGLPQFPSPTEIERRLSGLVQSLRETAPPEQIRSAINELANIVHLGIEENLRFGDEVVHRNLEVGITRLQRNAESLRSSIHIAAQRAHAGVDSSMALIQREISLGPPGVR